MTRNKTENRFTIVFGDDLLEAGYTSAPNLLLDRYAQVGMSPDELVFVLHLLQYKWTEKDPFPSLQTIARKMGKSWRQAHRYAQSLKRKLLLRITNRVLTGRGRTTSEYDLSPLFATISASHTALPSVTHPTDLSKVSDGPSVKTDRRVLSPVTGQEEDENEEYEDMKLSIRERGANLAGLKTGGACVRVVTDTKHVPSIRDAHCPRLRTGQQPVAVSDIVFQRVPVPSMVQRDEGREAIATYISGFARDFGDRALLKASVTRAYNLHQRSTTDLGTFLTVLYEAARRCKDYIAAVEALPQDNGRAFMPRNRMAYFFAIAERLLGLSEPLGGDTGVGEGPN